MSTPTALAGCVHSTQGLHSTCYQGSVLSERHREDQCIHHCCPQWPAHHHPRSKRGNEGLRCQGPSSSIACCWHPTSRLYRRYLQTPEYLLLDSKQLPRPRLCARSARLPSRHLPSKSEWCRPVVQSRAASPPDPMQPTQTFVNRCLVRFRSFRLASKLSLFHGPHRPTFGLSGSTQDT